MQVEMNTDDIDKLTVSPTPAPVDVVEPSLPQSEPDSTTTESAAANEPKTSPESTPPPSPAESDGTPDLARFVELSKVLRDYTSVSSKSRQWDFLHGDRWLRIEMSPVDFVESLIGEYGETVLREIGLHEQVGDDLRLPVWMVEDAVVFLQVDEENHSFKFHAVDKFAIDYAQMRMREESTAAQDTLFICDSDDSADIVRRLGLHSVSCEGLEKIGQCEVSKIFGGEHEYKWRYYLLLVDFDVAQLKNVPTDAIGEVIRRLADAKIGYRIDPCQRFGVCRPDRQTFERLKKVMTFKDPVQVAQLFNHWAVAAREADVSDWQTYLNEEPVTLLAARDELSRLINSENPFARREIENALSRYRKMYRRLIRQQLNDSHNSFDLDENLDAVVAAESAETFFAADRVVQAAEHMLQERVVPPMRELRKQALEEQLKLLKDFKSVRNAKKRKR
jgi:hypothetical protein